MDDQRLEGLIGNLLRVGVLLAAGVVTIGGLLYLFQHADERVDYHHFVSGPESLSTIGGVARSAAKFRSEGLIQLGLLMLIATPIARVLFAVFGFALERDWLYVAVSLIVFIVLVTSLLHAT
jgi:uncharacterized membrane protein